MRPRPDRDTYFMAIAEAVAARSTCLRAQYGAVIVVDGQIVSTGYNGAPARIPHCETCYREDNHIEPGTRYEACESVHAEQNAIVQAAKHGTRVDGGSLYVTGPPCLLCARTIINAGIGRVIYLGSARYNDDKPLRLLDRAGLMLWEMER